MRAFLVLLAISLAGCAASRPREDIVDGTIETTRVKSTGSRMIETTTYSDNVVQAIEIAAPLPSVWTHLAGAYSELDIPITVADTASHVLGTRSSTFRRQLAKSKVSTWVECGTTALGMKNADSYTVRLEIVTRLEPTPENHTLARTAVRGDAAAEGTGESRVRCTSNGRLERRISALVSERLAGK